jgi:tRNA (cytidine/uridine-2'-O-)-methyltransferase
VFTISLIEPQIPPNTGSIARMCAATHNRLEVVGKLGFELTDSRLKRAGLDYWKFVNWEHFLDSDTYMDALDPSRIHLFTTKSKTPYWEREFKNGDYLIFGAETTGLAEKYRTRFADQCCVIPMVEPGVRSLNLATSAGIGLFEAIRQVTLRST